MNKTLAALAALNEMHDQRRLQYRNHVQHLRQIRLQRQRSAVAREHCAPGRRPPAEMGGSSTASKGGHDHGAHPHD